MQAIVHSRYGAPDVLELKDIDQPVVNDDAVLVRVHAAAVGKGDWLTVAGLPYVARMRYGLPKPKHPIPGFDVAGRIEAVGSNVSQLQPGDEVFGWCEGSFAEYASVPQSQLVRKPANLTFEQAAAVPISGFAALQALRDTPAARILTLNVSLNDDEATGYTVAEHVEAVVAHAPGLTFDHVIADPRVVRSGAEETALRVAVDRIGAELVVTPVGKMRSPGAHDTLRLAAAYRDIMTGAR